MNKISEKINIAFVSIDVFEHVAPLASGFLEGYARTDPELNEKLHIQNYIYTYKATPEKVLSDLLDQDAEVFAFSCYVWNMGLIKKVFPELLKKKPNSYLVLGGPQVMNNAHKYLDPECENVIVCNGEGERVFRNILKEIAGPVPDFSRVKGISYYEKRELITTEKEQTIKELDEIPSPYLGKLVRKNSFAYAFLETTRGCPFFCSYCYWGGAIGSKLRKFDKQRVMDEIDWLVRNGAWVIFITDANWGVLERDVEVSAHLAKCREKYKMPHSVIFCCAKNSPKKVNKIVKMFHQSGLITAQSIGLQSMNKEIHRLVNRQSINLQSYFTLQELLNENGIGSYVELIWPLPGETLQSFKEGITLLCNNKAESIVFYPLLLMNNVELNNKREEYGLETASSLDSNSEAEVVVQSNEVSYEECKEGWFIIFTVIVLYTMRGLNSLSNHLHNLSAIPYASLFHSFVDFLKVRKDHGLYKLWDEIFENKSFEYAAHGRIVYHICHSDRVETDRLLYDFVSSQPWWRDKEARFFFEMDILNRPYVFSDTKIEKKEIDFQCIEILEIDRNGYGIEVPLNYLETARKMIGKKARFESSRVFVNHKTKQMPFMSAPTMDKNWNYCSHKIDTVGSILPNWTNYEEGEIVDTKGLVPRKFIPEDVAFSEEFSF